MEILNILEGRAEAAEAFAVSNEAIKVRFEAGRLRRAETEEASGIAVRVVKDGRIGAAASTDLTRLDRLAQNALASAAHGDEAVFSFAAPKPATAVAVCTKWAASLGVNDLVRMGEEMIEIVRDAEQDANIIVEVTKNIHHVRVANTLGQDVETSKTPLSLHVSVERVRDGDVLFAWEHDGTTCPGDVHRRIAESLARKLRLAKRSATIASGKLPVAFTPQGAVLLFLPIMEGLNGKAAYHET
ncbi:MAG: PmbA/TldA family metallopeptidase, partial [Armatimonadota bacterium]